MKYTTFHGHRGRCEDHERSEYPGTGYRGGLRHQGQPARWMAMELVIGPKE